MSLLGASLYSPELQTDHPITVIPVTDIADLNPMKVAAVEQTDDLDQAAAGGPAATDIKVGVSKWIATEAYDIDWAPVEGAVTYRVYSSMSPKGHGNLIKDALAEPGYRFFPPYFSEVVAYFFWVSWLDVNGVETFIYDEPASLMSTAEKLAFAPNPITDDPEFYPAADELNAELARNFEFIRSSNRLDIEIGSEPAFLYLRRHASDRPWGIPCACVRRRNLNDSDPDFQGVGRCKLCFRTGVFGGFLPKVSISVRYGNAPEQSYTRSKRGFQLEHVFNTYMLWLPVVRQDDLVVMALSGRRFNVEKVSPDISARGVRFQQGFDLREVEKTDILHEVTDQAIQRSLDMAKLPGFLREGYKAFS